MTRWSRDNSLNYFTDYGPGGAYSARSLPNAFGRRRQNIPRLNEDDVSGHGPETVSLLAPVTSGPYSIGVHSYDLRGSGATLVTVRTFCGEVQQTPLQHSFTATKQFWRVADVSFGVPVHGGCVFVPSQLPDVWNIYYPSESHCLHAHL